MFGAWGLVSRSTPGAGTAFYAFDERGNVAQRTSSSGAVTSTDLYDAYGQKRAGVADVWGFGGQAGYYTDSETGLVLCTHRFYDPQSGRFLTRDPIGYAGGINLYSYTQNNPVNWNDPTGLMPPFALAGGGLLGGGALLGEGGLGISGAAVGAVLWPVVAAVGVAAVSWEAGTFIGNHIANGIHAQEGLAAPYYATKTPLPPIITERDPTKNPLTGKDPADVVPGKELPGDWTTEAGSGPGTIRYIPPGYKGPQVLKEPGDPNATGSEPVHKGPYCRISPGNGSPFRIPLLGNPLNGPGF